MTIRTTTEVDENIEHQLKTQYKVDKNGCWIWQGQFWHHKRYGRIKSWRKDSKYSQRAHVASYQYYKGDVGRLYVCHSCDNPSCINPDHLWLGTNRENQIDAVKKGVFKRYWTKERRAQQSEKYSGRGNPMYGVRGKDAPCYGRTGEKHPMFGKHHTEEAKKKISESLTRNKRNG